MSFNNHQFTRHDYNIIGGTAKVDPRTVQTYLEGTRKPIGVALEAINEALFTLGYELPSSGEAAK